MVTDGTTPRAAAVPVPVTGVGTATGGVAGFVRRRPLLSFAVLACALSWAWWVPLLVAGQTVRPGRGWPTHLPGLLGPAVAAVVVTGVVDGRRGIGELLGRLARWRLGRRGWAYALSPLGFLAVGLAVVARAGRNLPSVADFGRFSGLSPVVVAVLVLLLMGGVGEELGWRGFLQQRLQQRHSPVVASLLVVPVWALWHLPLFGLLAAYRGFGPLTLVGFVVGLGCGSVLLGRVYGVTGGSVLATAVWHGTYNLGAGTEAGTGLLAAVITSFVMVWAVAVLLAAVRRSRPSPVNRVVLAILRSPLHRLVSGAVVELRMRGRRTGRLVALPVQYAHDGDLLVVLPGHARRKLWWRNLVGGAEVSVRLRGTRRHGRAETVAPGTPEFRAALERYLNRFPRAATAASSSSVLVTVTLAPALDHAPDPVPTSAGIRAPTGQASPGVPGIGETR